MHSSSALLEEVAGDKLRTLAEMTSDPRLKWSADRPHTLVIACSDGRLQEQTDEFLHRQLGLSGFDRFYVPGGGGALASSGRVCTTHLG